MARDEGAGAGSILLAFLLGAAAGAAVALLYAPQAGERTREMLAEKTREGRKRAADFAGKATDTFAEGREQLVNAVERGREAYRQARSEGA
jgi:gas vesicle protein